MSEADFVERLRALIDAGRAAGLTRAQMVRVLDLETMVPQFGERR